MKARNIAVVAAAGLALLLIALATRYETRINSEGVYRIDRWTGAVVLCEEREVGNGAVFTCPPREHPEATQSADPRPTEAQEEGAEAVAKTVGYTGPIPDATHSPPPAEWWPSPPSQPKATWHEKELYALARGATWDQIMEAQQLAYDEVRNLGGTHDQVINAFGDTTTPQQLKVAAGLKATYDAERRFTR